MRRGGSGWHKAFPLGTGCTEHLPCLGGTLVGESRSTARGHHELRFLIWELQGKSVVADDGERIAQRESLQLIY